LTESLEVRDASMPDNNDLREKLWTKMGFICDVRKARVEEEGAAAVSPTG
jgi:hypothetical protein